MHHSLRAPALAAGALATLLSVACSGEAADTPAAAATAAPATATSSAAVTTTSSAGGSSTTAAPGATPASTAKASANSATRAQLQAAFEVAGISNADRWAREVEEYRPYAADPSWAKLRQELAKYNPAPGVVDQIIATLEQ